MQRIVMIIGVIFLTLPAAAGDKTAMITGSSSGSPSTGDSVACEMRIKSALRELDYRMILQTSKEEADLQVRTWCSCYGRGNFDHTCSAGASVRRKRGFGFTIYSSSEKGSSRSWARSEACRGVANQLRAKLGGGSKTSGDGPKPSMPRRTKQNITVRWEGNLKPMPLIKLTGYFKDMGYQAKKTKSGANQVRFRVTIEEQPERFRSKLRTFLEAHYRVISSGGKSKLNFLIEAL